MTVSRVETSGFAALDMVMAACSGRSRPKGGGGVDYSQRVLIDTFLLVDTWGWFVAHRDELDDEGREILAKLEEKVASIERRIAYMQALETQKDPV